MILPSALLLLVVLGIQDASSELRPGEGRDLVLTTCTGCHTTDLIVASHLSRKSWDTTLTWMEETQGLSPLAPALRKAILDYLEKTQGRSGDAESETTAGPWASPRYRPNPIW